MNRIQSWKHNLLAFGFGILICVGILGLAEAYCVFFPGPGIFLKQHYSDNALYTDSFGITRPHPSQSYHVTKTNGKTRKVIYDVTYSADSFSRRITPVENPEERLKHLLFFTCSFAYGEGLQERETLPFRMGEKAPSSMPYNYAFHGHGPNQMYAKLKSGTLPGEVPQKDGMLIYVFINHHVKRVAGSMRLAVSWAKKFPYYDLGPQGEIIDKGTFFTGRPVLSKFYELLDKSRLLKRLDIDIPLRMTRKDFLLTARLIEESAKLYRQQFPDGQFVLVIFPGTTYGEKIKALLQDRQMRIIDASELYDARDSKYFLDPEDHHPTALAVQTLADHLTRELNLQN